MHRSTLLAISAWLLAASSILLLLQPRTANASEQAEEDEAADAGQEQQPAEDDAEAPKLNIDPAAVRDAIASLLKNGVASEVAADGEGYVEAAQEYLEHVQSVLSSVKSPSEVYVREQLADLEALDGLLASLEAAGARLTPSAGARLSAHLVKGPGRELLRPVGLEPGTTYAGSDLAGRLAEAAAELRRFLDQASASLAEDLRRHAGGLAAGRTRDYLDSVLDRVLELEGKKVRFSVEYPDAGEGEDGGLGEPRVSRAQQEEGDAESTTSDGDGDGGGRGLLDQVLGRRAAASVAAQLTEGGRAAAAARVQELRQRRYQPAGMEAVLEAIEQCLKLD